MSKLTQEQYDSIPDFLKSDYEKSGEEYIHIATSKIKKTANELNEKNNATTLELETYKSEEQARIDVIKQEAYDKAIADKDIEGVTTRHTEQLADATTRALAEGRAAAQKEFKLESAKALALSEAKSFSAVNGVDKHAASMLEREIMAMIEIDADTGERIYLDSEGRATALDNTAFNESVLNNPRYALLLKADVTASGGGLADGGNGGRAPTKKFNEYSGAELSQIRQTNPAEYEKLKLTR